MDKTHRETQKVSGSRRVLKSGAEGGIGGSQFQVVLSSVAPSEFSKILAPLARSSYCPVPASVGQLVDIWWTTDVGAQPCSIVACDLHTGLRRPRSVAMERRASTSQRTLRLAVRAVAQRSCRVPLRRPNRSVRDVIDASPSVPPDTALSERRRVLVEHDP